MKTYPSIPGIKNIPWGEECTAFKKLDGSNLRFSWSKKQGWYKFGTRRRLFDQTDKEYGRAIDIFKQTLADGIEKIIKDKYKSEDTMVYCELFGEDSFAGWHNFDKPFELKVIEIGVFKKGFILPQDFIDTFGHLNIAQAVFQGKIDKNYIETVRNDSTLGEGVVVKGTLAGKNPIHSYWLSKIKTNWWFGELRRRCAESMEFKRILEENEREQNE